MKLDVKKIIAKLYTDKDRVVICKHVITTIDVKDRKMKVDCYDCKKSFEITIIDKRQGIVI